MLTSDSDDDDFTKFGTRQTVPRPGRGHREGQTSESKWSVDIAVRRRSRFNERWGSLQMYKL